MTLSERISEDLKLAMKSGDTTRRETLRMIRASLMEKAIERRGGNQPMTPEDEVGVLTGAAKKRKESIEQFAKGGREDLVAQESAELQIIQEYLPRQLSREEALPLIEQIITDSGAHGAQEFGKVMPLAMKLLKGRADGKVVQELVKELLARGESHD